jgi:hypothetical protein
VVDDMEAARAKLAERGVDQISCGHHLSPASAPSNCSRASEPGASSGR